MSFRFARKRTAKALSAHKVPRGEVNAVVEGASITVEDEDAVRDLQENVSVVKVGCQGCFGCIAGDRQDRTNSDVFPPVSSTTILEDGNKEVQLVESESSRAWSGLLASLSDTLQLIDQFEMSFD